MSRIFANPIALIFFAIVVLILVGSTVTIVPETKQAVIVRFGQPERVLNRYRPNEAFGNTGAGVTVRFPFVDRIVWIDKRIQSIEMENQQVLSTEQQPLQVDAYARYRIVDPLRMYMAARSEQRVSEQLQPILGSALRNELGRQPFAALLSPERGQMMGNIRDALDRVAIQYGAQIVDVRIKRADLPEGTLDSAYERMRSARQQEARSIGPGQAGADQAEADAEAPPLPRRSAADPDLRFLPGDAVLPAKFHREGTAGIRAAGPASSCRPTMNI